MQDMVQQSMVAEGSFILFLLLLAFIPTLLCIILFFKIWIMTNDVSKIKDLLQEQLKPRQSNAEDSSDNRPMTD